jgi:hypothetical protein
MSQSEILDVVHIDGEGKPLSSIEIKAAIGGRGNISYQLMALVRAGELKMVRTKKGQPRYLKPNPTARKAPMRDAAGRYVAGRWQK